MAMAGYFGSPLAELDKILCALDDEQDDQRRADLIDQAIELADNDPACASIWKEYR